MTALPPSVRIAQGVTIALVMYAAIQLVLFMGVDEKSLLQRSWELVTGGSIGLLVWCCTLSGTYTNAQMRRLGKA